MQAEEKQIYELPLLFYAFVAKNSQEIHKTLALQAHETIVFL